MKSHFVDAFVDAVVFATAETQDARTAPAVMDLAENAYTIAAPLIRGAYVDRCGHAIALQMIGTGCAISDNSATWYGLTAHQLRRLCSAFAAMRADCYTVGADEEGGETVEVSHCYAIA